MKIGTLLDQIDLGTLTLPEFQRGYVWNRQQVRAFMDSLYRRYPVGSLLVWVTRRSSAPLRSDDAAGSDTVHLLLDGQQRLTTLYGIVRGRPPRFFQGDASAFTGLRFHVERETFEFYAPLKMHDDPLWVDVTELMQFGLSPFIARFQQFPDEVNRLPEYLDRLNRLRSILEIDLHVEQITGADKTIEVVVEIFNRVNSGGTKLSSADLALARLCVNWPEVRQELQKRLKKWQSHGFTFRLEWLFRTLNTVVTGERFFDKLVELPPAEVHIGLQRTEKAIDLLLNLISSRLGLDHDRVVSGHYALAVLARHLHLRDFALADVHHANKLLYWYIHSVLWGRYTGSTETILASDAALLDGSLDDLDRLIEALQRSRGTLTVRPDDLRGWSLGNRFYPLLYLLARVGHAVDWCTGVNVSHWLLGRSNQLQVHHIFPKALLAQAGYRKEEINAIANYAFLTASCNNSLRDRDPAEYLPEIEHKFPGALESQWIPMDRSLWRIERYREFLAVRRQLLADAANRFLDGLLTGTVPAQEVAEPVLARPEPVVLGTIVSDEEERTLRTCAEWVTERGLAEGILGYELVEPGSGQLLAVLDLAWPEGLQAERSEPVALLLDEPETVVALASRAGFRCFTSVADFQEYVRKEILGEEPVTVASDPQAT